MQNEEGQRSFSDIIVRADSKGKILDFRNNLNLAYPEHYAMLQGVGGNGFAYSSGIAAFITDYSKGTGEGNSITVKANLPPELFQQIGYICLRNTGSDIYSDGGATAGIISLLCKMSGAILNAINGSLLFCAGKLKKGNDEQVLASFGSSLKGAKAALMQSIDTTPPVFGRHTDFLYRQERVNVYATDNGFVPVSTVLIARQGIRKDGTVSQKPWTVKISNFMAKPVPHQNGTTAYDSASIKDRKEVFILLSDDDMHRCAYRVERFINVWECSEGIPLVKEGLAMRESIRTQHKKQ